MASPYETDLDRNAANFQPLTPLSFLARAAGVYPDRTAIIHGARSWTYREFYARARKLASALARHGIERGDTVSAVLANTPAMLEAHYGVAMAGGVLNTINTRLDAAIIAFTLDHGEAKVLIVDREFSKVVKDALASCKAKPLVIDYDDPEFTGAGERIGTIEYEDFLRERRSGFRLADAGRRMGRDRAQLHLRHHRRSQGRRLSPPRRVPAGARQRHHLRHGCRGWASIRSICGRCRCFIATAGASRGRSRSSPARMCACARCAPRRCTTPSPTHKVTHLCGAPIVMSTLLNASAQERKPLPHQVEFVTAAAPPPEAVLAAMKAAGFNVTHVYGLTETYGPAVVNDWHARMGRALRLRAGGARRRGRACAIRCSKRSTCSTPTRWRACRATARRSAKSCSAATW